MKLLVTTTVAAVLAAGTAFAQTQPTIPTEPPAELTTPGAETPPAPPQDAAPDAQVAPPPSAESGSPRDEWRAERRHERMMRRHHRAMREGDRRGPPRWRMGRHGRDPGPMGARFRIEVGEDGSMKLNVRCAANEPTQVCADVIMQIFDRLDPESASSTMPDETLPPSPPQQ